METLPLTTTPLPEIFSAFTHAFSDYAVPIASMPLSKFSEMLTTRSIDFSLSLGCFDHTTTNPSDPPLLVSFILCGHRRIAGVEYGYDGGTGTVLTHRKQGIGKRLVREWLAMLREKGINRVVLEVLEDNTPAMELYRKAGFRATRVLGCFRVSKTAVALSGGDEKDHGGYAVVDADMEEYRGMDEEELMTFRPSWQNAKESVLNVADRYAYVELKLVDGAERSMVGYGLVHKESGNIAQLGIAQAYRNQGLEKIILYELGQRTASDKLVFLNVEQGDYLGTVLLDTGFERFGGQYEMEYSAGGVEIDENPESSK